MNREQLRSYMAKYVAGRDMPWDNGDYMTARQCFLAVNAYQPHEWIPVEEFGCWDALYQEWDRQGVPIIIDQFSPECCFHAGFRYNQWRFLPVYLGPYPPFQDKIISQEGDYLYRQNSEGVIYRERQGNVSIPHYIAYPINNRETWLRYKQRLDPSVPERYGQAYCDYTVNAVERNYVLGLGLGPTLGNVRNWFGIEDLCISLFERHDLIVEIMAYLTEFALAILKKVLSDTVVDVVHFWEDLCYNAGPLVSPKFYAELAGPYYKKLTDYARLHGVSIFSVDCDGLLDAYIPIWLENGVNCVFPLERVCGSDPLRYRKEYGQQLLLRGGVDKRALLNGPVGILRELKYLEPLIAEGGFIPTVDHRIPQGVSLEDFTYYLKEKRALLGAPPIRETERDHFHARHPRNDRPEGTSSE